LNGARGITICSVNHRLARALNFNMALLGDVGIRWSLLIGFAGSRIALGNVAAGLWVSDWRMVFRAVPWFIHGHLVVVRLGALVLACHHSSTGKSVASFVLSPSERAPFAVCTSSLVSRGKVFGLDG
jgi:hypothetical protein